MAASATGEHVAGSPPSVGVPRFTAREGELAALTAALAAPRAVVLVEGEAGIGKSRLLAEYLATEAGQEARAVVAWCPPFRQPQTLGPVADAVQTAIADITALRLSPLAGALRPLFPEWAPQLPSALEPAEDATAARHRLFRALAEVLTRLETGLLVVEDVHWADEATLEFLLLLASRGPDSRPTLRILVTSRPEDVSSGSLLPRLARLAGGARGLRLALGPLTIAGTAALVSSMLGTSEVSGRFAAFLHEQTGGVPLAVEESVRLLAARTDLSRQGDRWVRRRLPKLAVPPTIRDAVLERAAGLSPDAREVLAAAAVLAGPAGAETIAVVAGLAPERAGPGLSEALSSVLLGEDERGLVSFRHALACSAVYESVPGRIRRVLHQRAGEALEELGAPAAALARYFREAGDTPRWLLYGEQAADLALAAGDQATSAILLCELVTGARLDAGVIAGLMDKMVLLALPEESQLTGLAAALRGVLSAGGLAPGGEAVLRFQLGRLLRTMYEAEESRAELERAVRGLPPGSLQAVRAMMLLGAPEGKDCTAAEHLRWLRSAAVSAADMPPLEQLRLTIDRAAALLLLGEESGWAEAEGIGWEPAAPRERLQVTRGHANIGEAAMLWGRYAEARRRLEHAAGLAHQFEYPHLQAGATASLAHLDWFTGSWQGLAGRAAQLAAGDGLPAAARQEAVLVGGLLASATGDRDRAGELLADCAGEALRRGDVQSLMEPAAVRAWMHLAVGEVGDALQVTQQPIELAAGKGIWLWAAELAPARVAALTAAGLAVDAAALVEVFARGLRGREAPTPKASLAMCRALLAESRGEHARAAGLFARAGGAWQGLPRPYQVLLARERQARCLIAAGQSHEGLSVLKELFGGFSGLGASRDTERVKRSLRQHGVRAWDGWHGGRRGYGDQLSPREVEVVQLVVAGRTTREIARELCRSPSTVYAQLSSARRKLGATSRIALALRATEIGITPGREFQQSSGAE